MKKQAVAILLTLVALLSVRAENDLKSHFEWVRKIDGSFSTGERGRVAVPGDVFGQARNFPNDLRILSADGTQWPFFLHIPKEQIETESRIPEILNRSFVSGREPYLQLDLVIPQKGDKKTVHNQVELVTSGRDFVRRVEVYEAAGNGLMAVGHLIDFSGQRGAQNRVVRYPLSDAVRLHIRIFPNARNADETFALASAKLRSRTVIHEERETVAITEMPVPERESEKGAQTCMFDLGEEGRPVGFIVFEVGNASYARCVSVYGRNTGREPWKWVGGGEIHLLEDDERGEVNLRARHRFIKLHVFHHDDQPLTIQSIRLEAVPRYLVFEAASDGQAGLYYRAWNLKPPRYDLKGRIETEILANLPVSQTLAAAPNEVAKARPWRKYSKGLGILAVGGVSLLVIGVIVRMLKEQKDSSQRR